MPKLPLTDWFVVAWFCSCWVGYTYFARRKAQRKASLVVAMRIYRREWFKHMLGHQTRIAHIAALSSLQSVTTFFASTALVILGGVGGYANLWDGRCHRLPGAGHACWQTPASFNPLFERFVAEIWR